MRDFPWLSNQHQYPPLGLHPPHQSAGAEPCPQRTDPSQAPPPAAASRAPPPAAASQAPPPAAASQAPPPAAAQQALHGDVGQPCEGDQDKWNIDKEKEDMDEINEKEIEDLFANFGVTCGTSYPDWSKEKNIHRNWESTKLTDFNANSKVLDLYCACAQSGMIVQLSLSPQASCNNPRKQKIFLRT